MQAIWLESQALSLRTDLPIPQPAPGQALIRLRQAGICSTDLELQRGYYPYTGIPGHEFVGDVVAAEGDQGDGAAGISTLRKPWKWVGQRVVGEINLTCGECDTCRAGRPTHCERRTTLGIRGHPGVFAEYLTLPLQNLHRVPAEVSDDAAVFCEPLAAALEIQQQVVVRPSDRVLVVGAGRLGMLVAQTLALTGCDLSVAVRRDAQRRLLEHWGIRSVAEDAIPGACMDLVVDVSGAPGGFNLARRAVRPRGTLVLKSTYSGDMAVNFSSLVVDEITLLGSRCGPFAPALALLASRRVDPTPLIEARYNLDEGLKAFEHAARPGAFKVLLHA